MNSYLNLVSEYAKAHKKKNRLTIVCIALSVMLITSIFGMADMSLKSQTEETIRRYGNWHAIFTGISDNEAAEISNQDDVNVGGWLGMASETTYQGKELIVQSSSEELARQMNMVVTDGHYPALKSSDIHGCSYHQKECERFLLIYIMNITMSSLVMV